jgi:hypothetical protein
MDIQKARRENLRWVILLALNSARPYGTSESVVFTAVVSAIALHDLTQLELRRELDYLAERELVEVTERDSPAWYCKLTRHGVDVVEYTLPCDPGIARPAKYW